MNDMHIPFNPLSRLSQISIHCLWLVLIVLTGKNSFAAEKSGSTCEKVYIHTDKTMYTAGEDMLYRVYTANPLQSVRAVESRILYFSMRGSGGQALQWRINLTKEDTWGRYRLPDDMVPGIYQLAVYTSQMRNLPADSLFSVNLLVTSLTKSLPDTLYVPYVTPGMSRYGFNRGFADALPERLEVSTNQNPVAMGDLMELKVLFKAPSSDTARLSVSVSLEGPLGQSDTASDNMPQVRQHRSMRPSGKASDCIFPLEDHGFMVTGTVKEKAMQFPLVNGKVLLSVADTLFPRIRFARTDSAGRFAFYLEPWYDNRELVFLAGEEPGNGAYEWQIDQKDLPGLPDAGERYFIQENDRNRIQTQLQSRLIEAVYRPVSEDKPMVPPATGIDYFNPFNFSVTPAEYQDMVNFKEIADNILPGVKFYTRNKTYLMQVLNSRKSQWNENGMVLLNGVPFSDFSYLATLGTKDISRIDVFTSDWLVGDYVFHGLVSVYTHDGKVPAAYLKNHTLTMSNAVAHTYTGGKASDAQSGGNHIPDFRTCLLWLDDLKAIAGKVISIPVTASHTPGVYRIVVSGLSREGDPLSATAIVTVK